MRWENTGKCVHKKIITSMYWVRGSGWTKHGGTGRGGILYFCTFSAQFLPIRVDYYEIVFVKFSWINRILVFGWHTKISNTHKWKKILYAPTPKQVQVMDIKRFLLPYRFGLAGLEYLNHNWLYLHVSYPNINCFLLLSSTSRDILQLFR